MSALSDEQLMGRALAQARHAAAMGEVPVGAVVSDGEAIRAEAANRRETDHDPTAHAEILALRAAARALGRWRLEDCTLAVTLEPCPMCAGALVHARLARLVYGAADPKTGAVESLYRLCADERLNHQPAVRVGVEAKACGELLRGFFRERRG